MELRQLRTFRMVATTRSFTQAAAALGYVQSSITVQIQALEASLGVPLFDRLGRQVALTDAGQCLLGYADRLLALADEARTAVWGGDEPTGSLTISAPETLCTYRLPAVLQRFNAEYPQVKLLFRLYPSPDMCRRVLDGTLDVALILQHPVNMPGLVVEPFFTEPVLVVASPRHALVQAPEVQVADLAGEPIFFTELGCSYRNQFEQVLIAGGVYPARALEFSSIEAIKQCVMTGMGITVLPQITVANEVAAGALAVLPWSGPPLEVVAQLVRHKDKWVSPALGAFLDIARDVLGVS